MLIFGIKSQSFFYSNIAAEITHHNDMQRLRTADNFLLPSVNGAYTVGRHDGINMGFLLVKTREGQLLVKSVAVLLNLFIIFHANVLFDSY